ncbi:MAG: type II secretion system F family protein [Candidatus Micrarchaeota archaeon]
MAGFLQREYLFFGKVLPEDWIRWIERRLVFAGLDEDVLEWAGRRFALLTLVCILASILPFVSAIYTYADPFETFERMLGLVTQSLLYAFLAFLLALFAFYTHLYYLIDDRTKRTEKALPDFLLLVVANLRAGMTPLNAFVVASRPEFGPLSEEVKKSAKKLTGGESISVMFLDLAERIDSPIFRNMVGFFDRAMRSGGRLANILESSADYVRRVEEMREEVVLITRSHVIFLAFMVIFIMPFLLSVSVEFVKLVKGIPVFSEDSTNLPFFTGRVSITPDFIVMVSSALILMTSSLVSLMLGIITRGQPFYGIKYVPIIAISSLIMFYVAQAFLSGLLSQFI